MLQASGRLGQGLPTNPIQRRGFSAATAGTAIYLSRSESHRRAEMPHGRRCYVRRVSCGGLVGRQAVMGEALC